MIGLAIDTATGDLLVENGSLVLTEVSSQVIEHVVRANRGEYREHPLLGAEVMKMQHGSTSRLWCARAKQMCHAAGVNVSRVTIDGNNITIS
ncbi:MAG: hypothetical protein ACI4BD_05945 [Paludibacteraceae bacterium]